MRRGATGAMAGLGAMLVALGACSAHHDTNPPGADEESLALAQDGTDANELESQASSLTASLTLGTGTVASSGTAPTADEIVMKADATQSFFLPNGCLTVAKDAAHHVVTYTFDACTGPWGLVKVSGTLVATYTTANNALQIDVGGANPGTPATLHFNRGVATYQSTATFTASGIQRSMTWTGTLDGETARGRMFHRSANWTLGWQVAGSCVSLDGTAEGDVLARKLKTEVTGYARCRDQCPNSGTVKITNETTGKSIELTYDGSNQATFTGVDGKSYQITLACGL